MQELKEGSKAPEFKLKNSKGEIKTLKDYKDKTLVLYFYPKDNTPGCTKEACSLRDGYKKLKSKKVEVVGVSPDSEQSHKKFSGKFKLPFELLADTDKKLAKKYGVLIRKNMFGVVYFGIKRTTFIIEKGRVRFIFEKVDVNDHANEILKQVKK